MIHFTAAGIYADSKEEKLDFLDRLCAGDPVVLGHIILWERQRELIQEVESEDKETALRREK